MSEPEAVRAWEETVEIPTYLTPPADKNPMFLEKRVYQGSSGKVYPCPFTDRVSDQKVLRPYRAIFLENEYIRLMLLPEIGGRIHIGLDKTNGYDFFYRQTVIKPALVGLLGPWISGGVEFNWPQHHRPTTFMPVEHSIEEHADGSRTVWLSEHEPMNRMKGMVGICLYPGKAFVEAKVRLYNRTPFVQTFLWWANAGVHVHDEYQAFFPPDVTFVADHAKRAVIDFPIAHGRYYGVDYTRGVDLRWYKNIPVPTSYMVTASGYDFFGGYDHRKRAGLVHYADHHVAPGKKMWTWGNHEFGYAWDRELTDDDGPYIELMAGVYTDNQPDFSWLHPYETRTFRQYWYPIQEIGPAKNANRIVAVNLERLNGGARIGVCATEVLEGVTIVLEAGDETVHREQANLAPGRPFVTRVEAVPAEATLRVIDSFGRELIRYDERSAEEQPAGKPATEARAPIDVATNESLYLTGLHLRQYRHATRDPEAYWREALARDPGDARANTALGVSELNRGLFEDAAGHFRAAIAALTALNPNPFDGEPFYYLGVVLLYGDQLDGAEAAFAKAAWNYSWRSAACYGRAQIACRRGQWDRALEYLDESLAANSDHAKARCLKAAALVRLDRLEEAREIVRETLAKDPLDAWARVLSDPERLRDMPSQTRLDVALDYAAAGFYREAADLVCDADSPALLFPLSWFLRKAGNLKAAAIALDRAIAAPPDYYFPSRLEEMTILQQAKHPRAAYYLGNLLYDKRRYEEAIAAWECAAEFDPRLATSWRNLGIAYYNVRRQPEKALECYERAFSANPSDARVLFEYDQLRKRTGTVPLDRLRMLESHAELVRWRDDLTIELVALYNQTGRPERALDILLSRRFHPWEGGEGKASAQYVAAHIDLGRGDLSKGKAESALVHFEAANCYPRSLGEGKHLLTRENHIHFFRGLALAQLGRAKEARDAFESAAAGEDDESAVAYYRAQALRRLGREQECRMLLENLRRKAEERLKTEPKIDYFATSLPDFLIFEDDLGKRNQVECAYLAGLAALGLGDADRAAERFSEAVLLDPNHAAAQELAALRKEPTHAGN